MQGDDDKQTLRPNDPVNFAEMLKMIVQTFFPLPLPFEKDGQVVSEDWFSRFQKGKKETNYTDNKRF